MKSEVVRNRAEFFKFMAPNFFGGGPQNFWTCIIKFTQIAITWQSFTAIGRGSSEVAQQKKKTSRVKHKALPKNANTYGTH